ncbi:MAG: hypothetical protein Q8N51_19775, partial [Gammaproteobacteria bacterium]|nr:hypothetical protein [Gammaproteobacteria bacterium]
DDDGLFVKRWLDRMEQDQDVANGLIGDHVRWVEESYRAHAILSALDAAPVTLPKEPGPFSGPGASTFADHSPEVNYQLTPKAASLDL